MTVDVSDLGLFDEPGCPGGNKASEIFASTAVNEAGAVT
jgi:hypothetical protein